MKKKKTIDHDDKKKTKMNNRKRKHSQSITKTQTKQGPKNMLYTQL